MSARSFTLVAVVCVLAATVHGQSIMSSSSGSSTDGSGSSSHRINIKLSAGDSVSLSCPIAPGGDVLWYRQVGGGKMEIARDSQMIVSDSRYQIRSENGAYVLTINPAMDSDSGVYFCERNSMSGSTHRLTYTVKIGAGGGATRDAAVVAGTIAAALLLLALA